MVTRAERSRSLGEGGTTAHSVSHSRSRSKHSRARMRMWLTEVRCESHAPSALLGDRQVRVLLWPRLRSAHASGPWAKGEERRAKGEGRRAKVYPSSFALRPSPLAVIYSFRCSSNPQTPASNVQRRSSRLRAATHVGRRISCWAYRRRRGCRFVT